MLSGKYTLKRQMAGHGSFARVSLSVFEGDPPLHIEDPPFDDAWGESSYWNSAAAAGITYALDRVKCFNALLHGWKGVSVRLESVHGTVADTTWMMVFFAAAMAFFDAVKEDAEPHIRLDAANREVVFRL